MPFNSPDLSEILTNEQTLNTNLISFRNELRNSLDTLGIEYESSDTILDLIRLLDWKENKAIDIDNTSNNDHVLDLISDHIAMVGPAPVYYEDDDEGWQLIEYKASPNYQFIPYTLALFGESKGSGDATGVWVFTNEEKAYTLNENWTYECIMHPRSGISGTNVYRGLTILLGSNWQNYSTYKGWCAGISLNGSTYSPFHGIWNSTKAPTMTGLSGRIYTSETYRIRMQHNVANHTITLTVIVCEDEYDYEVVSRVTLSVSDLTNDYSQEVRFGMLSKFYAFECPLYGSGYAFSSVKVR